MPTKSEKPVYEPWGLFLWRMTKDVAKGLAWFAGICVVASLALNGYEQLDLNGYIHHERTLDVYMTNNWLVGENRDCWLHLVLDANGKPTGKLDSLQCLVGFENLQAHNLPVTFKGIVDPKDLDGNDRPIPDQWICTRGSESFTCKVNAHPLYPTR